LSETIDAALASITADGTRKKTNDRHVTSDVMPAQAKTK